jgi:hypothetical protein
LAELWARPSAYLAERNRRTGGLGSGCTNTGRGRANRSARGPCGRQIPPHTRGVQRWSNGALSPRVADSRARITRGAGRAESRGPARGPVSSSQAGAGPLPIRAARGLGPTASWPSGRPAHAECVRARAAAATRARALAIRVGAADALGRRNRPVAEPIWGFCPRGNFARAILLQIGLCAPQATLSLSNSVGSA